MEVASSCSSDPQSGLISGRSAAGANGGAGVTLNHCGMNYYLKERLVKIDLYTKVVLTIIALCLVWLCVKDMPVTRTASAQGAQPVTIVGITQGMILPVGISGIDRYPSAPWEPLPVSETQNPLPVSETKNPLPVSVVPQQSGGQ